MKRTRNGILIPDVPIMAGGNLPNAVKGVSTGGDNWKKHTVDMGLPSGKLWADCNIDVNMPNGFCRTPFIYEQSFFSWGNIDGHNPVAQSFEDVYDWGGVNAAEPWYDGQPYGNTKGDTLSSNIPEGEEYDAARAILGEPWYMPSTADTIELFNNIIYIDADGTEVDRNKNDKRVTVNGVVGIYLQSQINGSRLFLAASGIGNNSRWDNRGVYGYYWTREIHNAKDARNMQFGIDVVRPSFQTVRYCGLAVRPICNP